jgi:predicted transcriptional regulator of viral defense system
MSAVDLTLLLKSFGAPVVTTSEVAALMRGRVDSANKMLGRLASKGVVRPVSRGLWALKRDLDPKVLSRYVAAPSPSYVSLLSALRYHGMLSQIPRSIYVVALGRPQEVETAMGDFSIHNVAPEVFGGFEPTKEGALVASPEKALFDVFYLSGTKPRTFSSLPEVELPDDFDFEKLRSWTRKIPSRRLRTIVERKTAELESTERN